MIDKNKNMREEEKTDSFYEINKNQLPVNLYYHRKEKLGLSQAKVAELLGKSEKTYQRWESTCEGFNNIHDLLNVFRLLKIPTTEIISILNLPPFTPDELKDIVQNAVPVDSIKEEGIYSYIRNHCDNMNQSTIEKLLIILHKEHLKRLNP